MLEKIALWERPAMSESSKVFMFDNDDPEMQRAYENARATFRYFWREVAWERRRIVPALDLACVKAPFSDGDKAVRTPGNPEVEHMWLGEVELKGQLIGLDFDGQFVSGALLNDPNWLKTIKGGDPARIPLHQISDWMYAVDGNVYGAYTVNLMRSRMGPRERKEHDNAWGFDFGDPGTTRVVPKKKGWFSSHDTDEHPMSEGMASSLKAELAKDPSMLNAKDDHGWTFLHQEALAGNTATVKVLLEAGADPNAVTNHGMTPLQLAKSLGWDKVVALLAKK
jgi:uncharacterized protein YegJ (DUF2314 family)